MKTFAVKEKRPAPATVGRRPYVHAPFGPVQRAQKARIGRILRSTGAQAKLTIGQPGDRYEQEADRVADQVVAMPDPKLQRQPENEEEEEFIQTKPITDQISPLVQRQEDSPEVEDEQLQAKSWYGETIQRMCPKCEEEKLQTKQKSGDTPQVTPNIESRIHSMKSGGQPLDATTRSFFEPRFGRDFSDVRIHQGGQAADISRSINARAFTMGNNIAFGSGSYSPESGEGKRLLGHELTHVLQQGQVARHSTGYLQRTVVASRVSCNKYPRNYPIFRAIGTTDPVGVLQAAVTRAIAMLDNAIDELTYGRNQIIAGAPVAWPTISDTVAVSLRDRLRIDPNNRNVWTGTGPRTVHHAIRWYSNIRRILSSNFMHYTCLDPDCNSGDIASAIFGESRIYLCRSFWRDTQDEQSMTLIHEASHIYYDTEDSGRGMGSAYCLEQFICDLQSISVCSGCG